MTVWWEELVPIGKFFACIAIPFTLALIIQIVLTLIGLGSGDGDVDIDTDGDFDADVDADGDFDADSASDADGMDSGLKIFSIRGMIAFFAIFGWTGLTMLSSGAANWLSILVAFAAGVAAMLVIAYTFKLFGKLQSDGTIDIKNALGKSGTVYITVPAHRKEKGKVNILLQGTYSELDAVTDEDESITFGREIVVIGISGQNTLIVKSK